MKILSIYRDTIKQFARRDCEMRPVLRFHLEFTNEYTGQIENLYLFSCVFYQTLMHGISQDPDPKSVIHWRTQLCYAMKEAMNETMNEDNIIKPFLLPNNVIHQLAEIVNKRIIEELEPGNQFHVVNEPKDTRRVLKKNNNRKDKNDCKEETGFFDKIIKYFKD